MGADLRANGNENAAKQVASLNESVLRLLRRLPWLDAGTASLLASIAADLASTHREVVALILFGSVTRHEERPITHRRPSDVDLLALVDADESDPTPLSVMVALHHAIGEREYAHPLPALGVQALLAPGNLAGWDNLFISNVASDGVLLWARGRLPDALAPVAARGAVFSPDEIAV